MNLTHPSTFDPVYKGLIPKSKTASGAGKRPSSGPQPPFALASAHTQERQEDSSILSGVILADASKPFSFGLSLDRKELSLRLGCGRATIFNRLNPLSPYYDPRFPRPVREGRRVFWVESEVTAYQKARIEDRDRERANI